MLKNQQANLSKSTYLNVHMFRQYSVYLLDAINIIHFKGSTTFTLHTSYVRPLSFGFLYNSWMTANFPTVRAVGRVYNHVRGLSKKTYNISAQLMKYEKVIIISSVKSNLEFPRRMKIAKTTKAYKLIPMSLILNIENLAKFSFGEKVNQRLQLYEKYLSVRDIRYLTWAVEQVILWNRTVADESVVHIHGDNDDVFPIKYITKCIVVKGGTHIMILNKYKWLNENLPDIIMGTNTNFDLKV